MMKKYFAVIILACCLTACGSSTGAADEQQSTTTTTVTTTTAAIESEPDSEPEETTTTTAAVESEPDSKSEEATTTTAPAEEKPEVTTFNTEWYPRESATNLAIGAGRHVYAAPTIESEQIGEIKAGDVVVCVGYVNEHWNVIQWNNDVGFIQTNLSDNVQIDEPVYEDPVYEDPANFDEPVQDNTTVEDDDFYLA